MSAEAYHWRCACCGEEFTGLPMDIALGLPVDWDALDQETRAASQLDEDFCQVRNSDGEMDRFIRCLLPLPVPGISSEFRFGVWMSVSERSWAIYRMGFDDGVYSEEGCFGYLMNEVPDYQGSFLLHADVFFQPGKLRPKVVLQEAKHPLVAAQRHGIDLAQIQRWAAKMHSQPS
jgi:hypothetical protein